MHSVKVLPVILSLRAVGNVAGNAHDLPHVIHHFIQFFQHEGMAREMLKYGMQELKKRGYQSVHFLVNKENKKALRSYAVFQFPVVGECEMFGQPFFCYESKL